MLFCKFVFLHKIQSLSNGSCPLLSFHINLVYLDRDTFIQKLLRLYRRDTEYALNAFKKIEMRSYSWDSGSLHSKAEYVLLRSKAEINFKIECRLPTHFAKGKALNEGFLSVMACWASISMHQKQ